MGCSTNAIIHLVAISRRAGLPVVIHSVEAIYPAFPFPNYTRITRGDSDAIYAYLMSLPPVKRDNTPHALRFPYNVRPLMFFWRLLYFQPKVSLLTHELIGVECLARWDHPVHGLVAPEDFVAVAGALR